MLSFPSSMAVDVEAKLCCPLEAVEGASAGDVGGLKCLFTFGMGTSKQSSSLVHVMA